VNPTQSWKSASAGRLQALLLLIYPVLSIPVVLAFLARYAFESELAFYAVLSVGLSVGVAIYWVSRDSAIEALETRKEKFLGALTASEGPISA
jgi:ABC-2 type transport system permease protein